MFFATEEVLLASTVESPNHDEEEAQVPTRQSPRWEGRRPSFRATQNRASGENGRYYYGNEECHCLTGTIIVKRQSTMLLRYCTYELPMNIMHHRRRRPGSLQCSDGNKEKSRSLRHSRRKFSDVVRYCDVRRRHLLTWRQAVAYTWKQKLRLNELSRGGTKDATSTNNNKPTPTPTTKANNNSLHNRDDDDLTMSDVESSILSALSG